MIVGLVRIFNLIFSITIISLGSVFIEKYLMQVRNKNTTLFWILKNQLNMSSLCYKLLNLHSKCFPKVRVKGQFNFFFNVFELHQLF